MAIKQGFPADTPVVDPGTGFLTLPWLQFYISIYNRTGGTLGNDSASFPFPVTSGTLGQVLTSQGSANPATWTTPANKLSQLTNDTGYITSAALAPFSTTQATSAAISTYVTSQLSSATPLPDAVVGVAGVSLLISRSDHVHPFPASATFIGNVTAQRVVVNAGASWTAGAGAPLGSAVTGSLYSNTTGGTGSRLYVSNGIGWAPVPGV